MTRRTFTFASAAYLTPMAGVLRAQGYKSFVFHGTVQKIDAGANSLTVDGATVPGWMDAMTRSYTVDKPEVLKTIEVGDVIEATVYDADLTLYEVHVIAKKDNR